MKLISLPDDNMKTKTVEELEHALLLRVIKLRKINKEMNTSAQVQKAQDALLLAKSPYKKAKAKWITEVEALEIELKSRDVKFIIGWDDIYED